MSGKKIGRYEVKAEEGRGGMATVYRAYDPRFGRDVAIKVLPPQFLHDPLFRERFDREAHTIAALEHSAIVPVYDFGEDQGQPYLVMRYMTGGSLAGRLKEGCVPCSDASAIIARVATGLDEAHKRGIIHRDLKPGNILFDQYGEAFLSDFGIAKLTEATAALTGSAIIGTPAYMSPEQARGDVTIDGRSDVYALGVILFEMLTGQAPYEADTPMGVAIKHILDPIPHARDIKPDLPPGIEAIVERAMAKDADSRFQTAGEMASAFAAVLAGDTIQLPIPERVREASVEVPPVPVMPQRPGASAESAKPTPVQIRTEAAPHKIIELPPVAKPVLDLPMEAKPQVIREYRRGGGGWLVGCLLVVLVVVLIGVGGTIGVLRGVFGAISRQANVAGPMETHPISEGLGDIEALDVTIQLVATDVELSALADDQLAAEGQYTSSHPLDYTYEVRGERGVLRLTEPTESFGQQGSLNLALSNTVPIDLVVRTGAGESRIDLSGLNLSSVTVEGGAGRLDVILPSHGDPDVMISAGAGSLSVEPAEDSSALDLQSLNVRGGIGSINLTLPDHGDFRVTIASGVGSINVALPDTLAAQVRVNGGIADVNILNDRFAMLSEGEWQTENFETSAEQVEIQIDAGLGDVTIRD